MRWPSQVMHVLLRAASREAQRTIIKKTVRAEAMADECRLAEVRITVDEALELPDARGRVTVYAITSKLGNAEYPVKRRFRDFVALHGALHADCPSAIPQRVFPLQKFPTAMPAPLRRKVEAARVGELGEYLRRTLDACAYTPPGGPTDAAGVGGAGREPVSTSFENAVRGLGGLAAGGLGRLANAGLVAFAGSRSSSGLTNSSSGGLLAAAKLLASFLEIPQAALLPDSFWDSLPGSTTGPVTPGPATPRLATDIKTSAGPGDSPGMARGSPGAPGLGLSAECSSPGEALRCLAAECEAVVDTSAASSKALWLAVHNAAAAGDSEGTRAAASRVLVADFTTELCALLASRVELLSSFLEASSEFSFLETTSELHANTNRVDETGEQLPEEPEERHTHFHSSLAQLESSLPSEEMAAPAVTAPDTSTHRRTEGGACGPCTAGGSGQELGSKPEKQVPAVTAEKRRLPVPADVAAAAQDLLAVSLSGPPAAVSLAVPSLARAATAVEHLPPVTTSGTVEFLNVTSQTLQPLQKDAPPRPSKAVAAALAGARTPSAELVEAYAREIASSFRTPPGLSQMASSQMSAGSASEASEAEDSSKSDAAGSEAEDAANSEMSADELKWSGALGANWDDALASLPSLPPPPGQRQ
jgi:hypothetical protein